VSNQVSKRLKWPQGFLIAAFLFLLIICTFLINIAIKNRLKVEELLNGQLAIDKWYSYSDNVTILIAGLLICAIYILMIFENLKLSRQRNNFENMALTDGLTGIFNRRYLEDTLNRVIKSFSRGNGQMSVLMVDVDFFKRYNDNYGHNMGDICLKAVAECLVEGFCREDDFAARYGGEEFVVVLPFTDENGAEIVANRILESMRRRVIPHEKSDVEKFVTVSIGGTTSFVKYTHTGTDYIKKADQALYMSKQNGRNMYSFLGFSQE